MAADGFDDDQTRSFTNLAAGTIVSHYKIISKIGAGGMGEVYLAEDTQLDRKVALKFLPHHFSQDEAARSRFTREAKAAAKLDHPNIVPVYEVGEFQGRPFFAMAHIEGKSLREVIKEGKLSTNESIEFTKQICEGLNKAHESGIVHRDIKPGNIIIDGDKKARILDFGLATVAGEDKLTKTGSTLGTVGYMSPEQIEGKQVDHRSDIFSVGVILYEMLTGRRPFEGDTDATVSHSITHSNPEPIARYKSGTTGELQQIVDKALFKDPSLRYQHADGMLTDLKRLELDPTASKRNRLGLWTALTVLVIVIGVGGYYQFFRSDYNEEGIPKRIVVLPFENQGEDEQSYFAAGITDEIMSRLTNISGMAVISRGSATKYRSAGLSLQEIGDTLGADYILDGTVRWQETESGPDRVRITTHLVRVDENVTLWSNVYDTVLTEVFNIQSDIAKSVCEQMNVVLLDNEKQEIRQHGTDNEQAYDFYLRGRNYGWRRGGYESKQDILLGIDMFKKAIALDSNFAAAYTCQSLLFSRLRARGYDYSDSCCQTAKELADRALELGTGAWEKYRAVGEYYYRCLQEYDSALHYYELAHEGNRNHRSYLYEAHNVLRRMGRFEEAYKNIRRVIELNPNSTVARFDLADDCLILSRYSEAEGLLDTVIMFAPDFFRAYDKKIRLYLNWQGDVAKAKQVIETSRGFIDSTRWRSIQLWLDMKEGRFREPLDAITMSSYDSASYYFERTFMYRRMGDSTQMRAYADSAVALLERRRENYPEDYTAHTNLGRIYAVLGREEEAISEGLTAAELRPLSADAVAGYYPLIAIFEIYLYLGDIDRTVDYLDTLLSIPGPLGVAHMFADPDYTPILSHPRFPDLVRKHADPEMVAQLLERL